MDDLAPGRVVTEELRVRVGHGSDKSAEAAPFTRSAAAATALLETLRGHTKHGLALAQQAPFRPQEVGEEDHQATDDASPPLPPSPAWCVVATLCHRAAPTCSCAIDCSLRDRRRHSHPHACREGEACMDVGEIADGGDVPSVKMRVFVNDGPGGAIDYSHMAMIAQTPPHCPWRWILMWQSSHGIEGTDDQHFRVAFSHDAMNWSAPLVMSLTEGGPVWGPVLHVHGDVMWLFYSESVVCKRARECAPVPCPGQSSLSPNPRRCCHLSHELAHAHPPHRCPLRARRSWHQLSHSVTSRTSLTGLPAPSQPGGGRGEAGALVPGRRPQVRAVTRWGTLDVTRHHSSASGGRWSAQGGGQPARRHAHWALGAAVLERAAALRTVARVPLGRAPHVRGTAL